MFKRTFPAANHDDMFQKLLEGDKISRISISKKKEYWYWHAFLKTLQMLWLGIDFDGKRLFHC
jgi:hypothetical protein